MNIVPDCPYPVWYQFVTSTSCTQDCPPFPYIPLSPTPITWAYDARPYTGIPMKVSKENFETSPDIMQIEYTWEQNARKIWFDSSSINGAPFIVKGFQTMPSTGLSALFPNCTGAYCLPGGECESAYFSDDSEEGRSCPDSTSVTFIACSE